MNRNGSHIVTLKIAIMNVIIIISSLIGVFGVYEITKGAKLHELNYLHEKYNHLFMKEVYNFQSADTGGVALLTKRLENLRRPPTECLELIGWLEVKFLQWIGTERAITLCQDDLLLSDETLDSIFDYELGNISKANLIVTLNRSINGFQIHSHEFNDLVEGSVRTYFILILYLVIIKAIFVVAGCFFILKSLSKDYQELKKQEAITKQTKKDFEMIYNLSPVGICYKDDKNNIINVNKMAAEVFGLPEEKLIGSNTFDLMPEMAQKYYLDDLEVIESGVPKLGIVEEVFTAEGDLCWVKTDKVPYVNPETGTIGILLFFQDITAVKLAEERLDLAWQGSGDGYWDWDMTTNKVVFSKRFKELLGYQEEEYSNRFETWTSSLHPDEKNDVLKAVDRHLKEKVEYDIEYRMQTKVGCWRWFRARGVALRRENGEPYRMSGSIQDITDFKADDDMKQALIKQLKKANAELGRQSGTG